MKTFVESQFNYCPLIWMIHARGLNDKINNVHEKVLRIDYSSYRSTFQELLDKDTSFSVHHRNIQIFMGFRQQLTELYHITSEHTMRFSGEFLK